MSRFLLLLAISGSGLVLGQDNQKPPPGGYYTTRYDHIDVENILNQKRLVYYYSECLLDRRPCTPQGIEFKRILPEAIRTNCLRCTEKQRFVTMKSIKRLMKEYPEIWAQLAAVWDPTGEYVKILEESLTKKTNRSPTVGAETIIQNSFANAPEKPKEDKTKINNDSGNNNVNNNNVKTNNVNNNVKTNDDSNVKINNNESKSKTNNDVQDSTNVNLQNRFSEVDSSTTVKANTVANKPISFSTPQKRAESTINVADIQVPTTEGQISGRKNNVPRVNYNYDFALTVKPPVLHHANGLNIVLKGVNNIIAPITDIAGKVITAGTDLAGMVLNVLGVKKS